MRDQKDRALLFALPVLALTKVPVTILIRFFMPRDTRDALLMRICSNFSDCNIPYLFPASRFHDTTRKTSKKESAGTEMIFQHNLFSVAGRKPHEKTAGLSEREIYSWYPNIRVSLSICQCNEKIRRSSRRDFCRKKKEKRTHFRLVLSFLKVNFSLWTELFYFPNFTSHNERLQHRFLLTDPKLDIPRDFSPSCSLALSKHVCQWDDSRSIQGTSMTKNNAVQRDTPFIIVIPEVSTSSASHWSRHIYNDNIHMLFSSRAYRSHRFIRACSYRRTRDILFIITSQFTYMCKVYKTRDKRLLVFAVRQASCDLICSSIDRLFVATMMEAAFPQLEQPRSLWKTQNKIYSINGTRCASIGISVWSLAFKLCLIFEIENLEAFHIKSISSWVSWKYVLEQILNKVFLRRGKCWLMETRLAQVCLICLSFPRSLIETNRQCVEY